MHVCVWKYTCRSLSEGECLCPCVSRLSVWMHLGNVFLCTICTGRVRISHELLVDTHLLSGAHWANLSPQRPLRHPHLQQHRPGRPGCHRDMVRQGVSTWIRHHVAPSSLQAQPKPCVWTLVEANALTPEFPPTTRAKWEAKNTASQEARAT